MSKRFIITIAFVLVVLATPLSALYYQDTLFPIGLSGIMYTGSDRPYGGQGWTWLDELRFLDALGVNCLGSEDSYNGYLIDFSGESENDYLHQVCMPAEGNNKPVYLIIPYSYSTPRYYDYGPGLNDSTPVIKSLRNILASTSFRSPERPEYGGYGCARFHPDTSIGGWYPFGTTSDANWCTFDGTDLWRQMVDETVDNFEDYFLTHPDHAQYVWGYNLITEDPAICRGPDFNPPWHGVWAAVDRVFKKHIIST